jgi:hypothetical protein
MSAQVSRRIRMRVPVHPAQFIRVLNSLAARIHHVTDGSEPGSCSAAACCPASNPFCISTTPCSVPTGVLSVVHAYTISHIGTAGLPRLL